MKRLLLALALTLCVAVPASAQMYKWVDSNGQVHYTDKPPPGNIKTEKLRPPPPAPVVSAPTASGAKAGTKQEAAKDGSKPDAAKDGKKQDAANAAPKTPFEQEQAFRKRQAESAKTQEAEAKKLAQARDKAENCRRAKAAVANLQAGGRQMRVDEKGERVFLDDAQVASETAKAQQEAVAACK